MNICAPAGFVPQFPCVWQSPAPSSKCPFLAHLGMFQLLGLMSPCQPVSPGPCPSQGWDGVTIGYLLSCHPPGCPLAMSSLAFSPLLPPRSAGRRTASRS